MSLFSAEWLPQKMAFYSSLQCHGYTVSLLDKNSCNNTQVKHVSIEIYGRVWREQPRGKPEGAKPPKGFPNVDPDT